MTVSIEKNGSVWTVIHDRPEARNAMDPASADALTEAFLAFDADDSASVAVFYGAGGAFLRRLGSQISLDAQCRTSARRARHPDNGAARQRRRDTARTDGALAA